MDFGEAFLFVFRDPDWPKKILTNGLIGLIPIVGWLYLLGWGLETIRRVIHQDPYPLPESNFGGWLGYGWRAFIVSLVYSLPIWLFLAPMILAAIAGGLFNLDEDTMGALMGITGICGILPMIGYEIFMSLLLMPALTLTALENSTRAGLRFREVFRLLRAGLGSYLLAWVAIVVAFTAINFIFVLLGLAGYIVAMLLKIDFLPHLINFTLGWGTLALSVYQVAVMGHFCGQTYRVAQPAPAWSAG